MSEILELEIDPDITLDPNRIKGMPDSVVASLLMMLTRSAEKHNCHWSTLTWKVPIIDGQPIIMVKHE